MSFLAVPDDLTLDYLGCDVLHYYIIENIHSDTLCFMFES